MERRSSANRAIIHLDMDAFYASVEQRNDPSLRGRPVIVGGHRRRGVVLAASYEVRPFGVRSAIPMARALKLAPDAVVVTPHFSEYVAASERVFAILHQVTPLVEPLSLDEAFLDVTASISLFGPPPEIARGLRRRIADEVGLPASAGLAAVKFIAKIASDLAKPDGQREVAEADGRAFLAPLSIGRLWGVGPKTERMLRLQGIETIGDVAARDPAQLERRLGPSGRDLWNLSQAVDPRPVIPDRDGKSIGSEDTFDDDLRGTEALRPYIHAQALRVAERLRAAGQKARTVQLKIKLADFTLLTRRSTYETAVDDGQTLYRTAMDLLAKAPLPQAVRLTGVSAQNLDGGGGDSGGQLPMFAPPAPPTERLNAALDRIGARFGQGVVTTADLTGPSIAKRQRLSGGRSEPPKTAPDQSPTAPPPPARRRPDR
ncbi:MAG TPA: DNA polymerase IV [Polyangia bacterium]|jgi:DNA polymerase-4|nr:DNA polymerase IV [Polyangia bacterium]